MGLIFYLFNLFIACLDIVTIVFLLAITDSKWNIHWAKPILSATEPMVLWVQTNLQSAAEKMTGNSDLLNSHVRCLLTLFMIRVIVSIIGGSILAFT